MLQRDEGYLLSTASAAGLLTQLGAIGYATTKHAAVAVAEWIDITYRDQGIRVSCLCPQFVNTPMVSDDLDVDKLRQIAQIIEPEQVADDVVDGDAGGAVPDPPPPRGRRLHAQPRRRPRSLARRDAQAAGTCSAASGARRGSLSAMDDGDAARSAVAGLRAAADAARRRGRRRGRWSRSTGSSRASSPARRTPRRSTPRSSLDDRLDPDVLDAMRERWERDRRAALGRLDRRRQVPTSSTRCAPRACG